MLKLARRIQLKMSRKSWRCRSRRVRMGHPTMQRAKASKNGPKSRSQSAQASCFRRIRKRWTKLLEIFQETAPNLAIERRNNLNLGPMLIVSASLARQLRLITSRPLRFHKSQIFDQCLHYQARPRGHKPKQRCPSLLMKARLRSLSWSLLVIPPALFLIGLSQAHSASQQPKQKTKNNHTKTRTHSHKNSQSQTPRFLPT